MQIKKTNSILIGFSLGLFALIVSILALKNNGLIINNSDKPIEQVNVPTKTITPTTTLNNNEINEKQIRIDCSALVKLKMQAMDDDKSSTSISNYIFVINSIYRLCLSENGLQPEDLFPQKIDGNYSTQNYVRNNDDTSNYEKNELEKTQKCQEDINKYNLCMNTYNANMAEYNTCLAKKANPSTSYDEARMCFKPISSCFKPFCAY